MFDEIESLIKSSKLPDGTKTALAILTSAIKWMPWPFVGIGLLIKINFFPYWLGFFILIESILFLTLIYLLVNISRRELGINDVKNQTEEKLNQDKHFFKSIKDGITGNIGFYLFIILGFIILKFLGVFEGLFNELSNIFK